MPRNTSFHFKQFSIKQDRTAMKVTSDACIFGAWLNLTNKSRILDIGTGTGLLALMAAQRSHAQIDALEIDSDAVLQARSNIAASPWHDRIFVYHRSLWEHSAIQDLVGAYDCIICNPPFYEQAIKSQDEKRRLARHVDELNLDELFASVSLLLKKTGTFSVLLPFSRKQKLEESATAKAVYMNSYCMLRSLQERPPHRLLVEFGFNKQETKISELVVYQEEQKYSEDCRHLLIPYFITL